MIPKFPLLQKELLKQAHSEKIYIIRIVYGFFLYIYFLYFWRQITDLTLFEALGQGEKYFQLIEWVNYIAIFTILPFLSSSLICSEKEKNTLSLLLICKVSHSSLLFEKMMSVVLIVASFLMMSLPVLLLSYLLGGVTMTDIAKSFYLQLLTMLQVAAVGVMCSCRTKGIITAVTLTYITIIGFYVFLPIVDYMLPFSIGRARFPPFLLREQIVSTGVFPMTIFTWLTICIAFRRAVQLLPKNSQKPQKKKQHLAFSLEHDALLTTYEPIYWNEVQKKGIHIKWKYLFVAMFIFAVLALSGGSRSSQLLLIVIYLVSLVVGFFLIAIKSSLAFRKEYKQNTWNLLLTTQMRGQEILSQKNRSISNLTLFMCFLLAALSLCPILASGRPRSQTPPLMIWMFNVFFTCCTFFSIQWLGLYLGLRFREKKVTVFYLIFLLLLSIVPLLLAAPNPDAYFLMFLSPFVMIIATAANPDLSAAVLVTMVFIYAVVSVYTYSKVYGGSEKYIRH